MRRTSIIALGFFLFGMNVLHAPPALAQEVLDLVWQHVDLGTNLGTRGMDCTDVDGDGDQEILLTCGTSILASLEHNAGEYDVRSAVHLTGPSTIVRSVVYDPLGDGQGFLYVFMSDATVQIRKLGDLSLSDAVTVPHPSLQRVLVANVLPDAGVELVLTGGGRLMILDGTTFAVLRDGDDLGSSAVAAGDVDDDGRVEIVTADGRILDADTLTEEWRYLDGFGVEVGVGDLDGDGVPEIVGMESWDYVTVFDGRLQSPLWQIDVDDDLETLLVTDVDGDGSDEILTGNGQWGDISCWDPATQALAWSIHNPDSGTTRLAVGDTDGDGVNEVVWGAGHTSSGADILYVGDTDAAAIEWLSRDLDGPFNVTAGLLLDDATPSLVLGSRGSNSGYDEGVFMVFDSALHQLAWDDMLPGYSNDLQALGIVHPDDDLGRLLVIGSTDAVTAWSPATQSVAWEAPSGVTADRIAVADLEGDGADELVLTDPTGHVRILDPATGAVVWSSIDTGATPLGLALADVDADPALEICFVSSLGTLFVYDGATHLLERQIPDVADARSVCAGDWNLDGVGEIFVGRDQGEISIYDGATLVRRETMDLGDDTFTGLALVNLDDEPGLELVAGSHRLVVVAPDDGAILWERATFGAELGLRNAMVAGDWDNDGHMDLLVGGTWGGFHLEAGSRYPDTTPPRVTSVSPRPEQTYVGLDTPVIAEFDEELAVASLPLGVSVSDGGVDVPIGSVGFDAVTRRLTILPDGLWPAARRLDVRLHGTLADTAGNGLDGNRDGVSDGSPDDDHVWGFVTGTAVDTVGARVVEAAAQDTVWSGVEVRMTATVSDQSVVATSTVAAVEYFVNAVGEPGTGTPLQAVDGAFDEIEEEIDVVLATTGWPAGPNVVTLRAADTRGNWGDPYTLTVFVLSQHASAWPQYGYDAAHAGHNPAAQISDGMSLAWTSVPLATVELNPVCLAGGVIYATARIYHNESTLWALDAGTGEVLWSRSLNDPARTCPPSFGYGMVYVQTCNHSGDSWVWAFDALSGDLVWKSAWSCQWESYLAPTISEGKVLIGGGYYGGMYAFDAFDGGQLWWANLGQYNEWTPAVHDNVAYASIDGRITALNATNGQALWDISGLEFDWHGYSLGTAPVVGVQEGILLATSFNDIHAVDLESHEVLWHRNDQLGRTPAVLGGRVYLPTDAGLKVLDIATGDQLAMSTYTADDQPILASDRIVLATETTTRLLHPQTMAVMSSIPFGGHVSVAGARIVVAASDGSGVIRCFHSGVTPNDPEDLPDGDVIDRLAVSSCRPNPFNARTVVHFALPRSGPVSVAVYDVRGELVDRLFDGSLPHGRHEVAWDGRDRNGRESASGIYFVRIVQEDAAATRKIMLTK